MNEQLLVADGAFSVERPITYSELVAARHDLSMNPDNPVAIANAKAARLRGQAGPASHEAWMQEGDDPLWTKPLQELGNQLDIINQ
jgi:hypothetical protein